MAAALNEVVQALQLFMRLQHCHISQATLRQLKLGISVEFKVQTAASDWTVKVLVSGLGAYFLDGTLFLKKLCEPGSSLNLLLQQNPQQSAATAINNGDSFPLQLLCRRIGDFATLMCYQVEWLDGQTEPVIRESTVARPHNFAQGNLVLTFTLSLSIEEIILEARRLAIHLHLLHLINPEVSFMLSMKQSGAGDFSVNYKQAVCKAVSGYYKLAISLHHYMDCSLLPVRPTKLHLLKGDTNSLPPCLPDPWRTSFHLYCTVAISPHLPLRRGKKIPADKIYIFGPCQLPLFPAGSQAMFPLSTLADWESYGLAVRQSSAQPSSTDAIDTAPVRSSLTCDITSTRPAPNVSRPSSVKARRTLHLFLFLEASDKRKGPGSNSQWQSGMELHQQLRQSFQTLVVTHSKKFYQATHSALNKLICNYGSHAKACAVMGGVIPLLSEAVASIVIHSTSDELKTTAKEILQVTAVEGVETSVTDKLWKLAKSKLQISHPSETVARTPNEPTTPEIIEAVSNSGKNDATTTQAREQPQIAASQHSTPASDTTPTITTQSSQLETAAMTSPEVAASQSLFAARVGSKRAANERVTPIHSLPERGGFAHDDDPTQSQSSSQSLLVGETASRTLTLSACVTESHEQAVGSLNPREDECSDDSFDALSDITALDSEYSAPMLTQSTELDKELPQIVGAVSERRSDTNYSGSFSETKVSEFDELGMQEASFEFTPPSPPLIPPLKNQPTSKQPFALDEDISTEYSDLTVGFDPPDSNLTVGFDPSDSDLTVGFDLPDSNLTVGFDPPDSDRTMACEAVFPLPGSHENFPIEQAKAFSDNEQFSTDEEWDALSTSDISPPLVTVLNTTGVQSNNLLLKDQSTRMYTSPQQHRPALAIDHDSDCTRMDDSFECLEHFLDSPDCEATVAECGTGVYGDGMELDCTDLEWEQSDVTELNQDENVAVDSISICDDIIEQDFHWE